jgi:hypothetical protein
VCLSSVALCRCAKVSATLRSEHRCCLRCCCAAALPPVIADLQHLQPCAMPPLAAGGLQKSCYGCQALRHKPQDVKAVGHNAASHTSCYSQQLVLTLSPTLQFRQMRLLAAAYDARQSVTAAMCAS